MTRRLLFALLVLLTLAACAPDTPKRERCTIARDLVLIESLAQPAPLTLLRGGEVVDVIRHDGGWAYVTTVVSVGDARYRYYGYVANEACR